MFRELYSRIPQLWEAMLGEILCCRREPRIVINIIRATNVRILFSGNISATKMAVDFFAGEAVLDFFVMLQ